MAILKKDLTALRKEFKAIENKMAKLLKAFETSSKPKKATKAKAVKAKPVKKASAKKAPAKKAVAKKAAVKKAVAKKAPAKKAAAKKAPVKKAAAKKAPAKKTLAKKTVAKKTTAPKAVAIKAGGQETATDQVLTLIKKSKNGVDVPSLKKQTGFNDKKVRNIVFRAAKEGRIKKSGRGIYVGA